MDLFFLGVFGLNLAMVLYVMTLFVTFLRGESLRIIFASLILLNFLLKKMTTINEYSYFSIMFFKKVLTEQITFSKCCIHYLSLFQNALFLCKIFL